MGATMARRRQKAAKKKKISVGASEKPKTEAAPLAEQVAKAIAKKGK